MKFLLSTLHISVKKRAMPVTIYVYVVFVELRFIIKKMQRKAGKLFKMFDSERTAEYK